MSELTTPEEKSDFEANKNSQVVSENSRKHFKYRSNECLNCSQPLDLSDRFCPYCSQLNSTKPLSLKDFIEEFFSSLISYDSRIRYTVKDLLFKPGIITRNYVSGERLKYTNPFRFFLSVSIIYFLIYGIINFFDSTTNSNFYDNDGDEKSSLRFDGKEGSFYINEDKDDLEKVIKQLRANPTTAKWGEIIRVEDSIRDAEIKKQGGEIKIINGDTISEQDYAARVELLDNTNTTKAFFDKFNIMQDFYNESKIENPSTALDSLGLARNRTNTWLYSKNKTIERIEEEPYKFIQFVISKTPFFLFFFAPFFALFFWLIYARRSVTYMEHLVFIFHIFSFVFLVMLILAIPEIFFDISIVFVIFFLLIAPFYFYKALRNFYKQSRVKTIIKFVILNIVFTIGASISAALFFLATAVTY